MTRNPNRRASMVALVVPLIVAITAVAYAARSGAIERGWRPAILLAGAGDSVVAVDTLRKSADLWRVTLNNTDVDPATRDFGQRVIQSLRDFDLGGLYKILPERNGAFRELRVQGRRAGPRYVVARPNTRGAFEVNPDGTREAHGDASFVLRSRGVRAADGDTNYLIQARAGVAIGAFGWPMVLASNRAWLHLFDTMDSSDESARPMLAMRHTAAQANPRLGPEDLELVATLWEAFPRMSYLLSSVGRIDDLIQVDRGATHDANQGAQHVRVEISLDPRRMRESYPELADYLKNLSKLLRWDIDWVDTRGRTVARAHMNSEHLQAHLELYAKDGHIVPFKGSTVFVDEPIDPTKALRYSVRARSDFRMMGMYSHMRDGRVDVTYAPTERGMELHGRMTHVPTITVDGAAFGFLPPGLIDAFIPGSLEGLMREFLTTACRGNDGRGIAFTARFDQRPSGMATVDGKIGFEALNNFLVKLGVRFFNDRVMPNEAVDADIKRLLIELQGAFSADLERYARAR